MTDHRLFNPKEAAKYLGVSTATLMKWRMRNNYNLPFIRIGRMCKYRLEDLVSFLSRHTNGEPAKMNYGK